jgi:DNA-binding winged helix-turn-helix (wHTH) protein
MQRRDRRTKRRQSASRQKSRGWVLKGNAYPVSQDPSRLSSATAASAFEFGRFRVLLRERQLLADGVPVGIGSRAFDLLAALLEADGLLVPKGELISRVWPGVMVSEENLKVQVSALRRVLGADRDAIRTEFGRGYRFTAVLRSTAAADSGQHSTRSELWSGLTPFPPHCRQSHEAASVRAADQAR